MKTPCASVVEERLKKAPKIELVNDIAWRLFKNESVSDVADYTERWARLMQFYMAKGERLCDVAEAMLLDVQEELITKYSGKNAKYISIDYLNTCAILVLTQYWKYGEELKRWHDLENEKYFDWMKSEISRNFNKQVWILVNLEKFAP